MDVVITYVNQDDRNWRDQFLSYFPDENHFKSGRYNDTGTLKYLLRGIETNMKFIENVFLVVSSESQVPDWINQKNVHVILHKDIIPERFLPCFNSSLIDMYLHKIPELNEEFIFLNDDMIPYSHCEKEDFFQNGHPICKIYEEPLDNFPKDNPNWLNKLLVISNFVYKSFGIFRTGQLLFPEHGAIPFLKSECIKIYNGFEKHITKTFTRLRNINCINGYIYITYPYLKGLVINQKTSVNTFYNLTNENYKDVLNNIISLNPKIISLNEDYDTTIETMSEVLKMFDKKLNNKSIYEL